VSKNKKDSKRNGVLTGAAIMMFILSFLISFDICSRGGRDWKWYGPMTLVLFLGIYVPWVATVDKNPTLVLPLSGLFASIIVLGASLSPTADSGVTWSQGLQGGVITLMYMFVSTALGYQAVRAKKDPAAKGQSIYMAGLLVLLLMFDVLGARNASTSANQAEHSALVAQRKAAGLGENGLGGQGALDAEAPPLLPTQESTGNNIT
jgi:hypothetical protein